MIMIILINMVTVLMMSAKKATLGLLKLKVFWNKDNEVRIFVHGVTNEVLLRESKYIVDVVVWPKFDNSGIFLR